jgi:hypothetical protein
MPTIPIQGFSAGPEGAILGPYADLATLTTVLPAQGHQGRLAAIGTTGQYIYYISQNSNWAPIGLQQFTTAARPPYTKGFLYFDLTLNKLVIGGASAYETVTSV